MAKLTKHKVVYVPTDRKTGNTTYIQGNPDRLLDVKPEENVYVLTESELRELLTKWDYSSIRNIDEFIKQNI